MLGGELYRGDCLEIMPRIPKESVDLVLCDLPYGTTASSWDKIIPMDKLWAEYTRILKPRGTVALFCVQPFTSLLVTHGLKGKLHYRYMWVWLKNNKTNFGNAHKQPLRQYEEIAVFGKVAGKYNPQNTKKLDEPIIRQPKPAGVYHGGVNATIQTLTNYPANVLEFKKQRLVGAISSKRKAGGTAAVSNMHIHRRGRHGARQHDGQRVDMCCGGYRGQAVHRD